MKARLKDLAFFVKLNIALYKKPINTKADIASYQTLSTLDTSS